MEKVCVFCGERPVAKTKEHVLPQWLLEMTGDPKRPLKIRFPYATTPTPDRTIAYDSLHFPACDRCNNDFSSLEGDARVVVDKLLHGAPMSAQDFNVLLAWLDKVRVGLWLGFLYLGQNPFSITPSFHIAKRLSTKDRVVSIHLADDDRIGLHFQGVNVPLFHFMPSCFTLVINQVYLTNISTDFLLARRIGFPFPTIAQLAGEATMLVHMQPGRERVMLPLIRLPANAMIGSHIYQPIFANEVFQSDATIYDSQYVRDLSLDWDRGIGFPVRVISQRLAKLPMISSGDWRPRERHPRSDLHVACIRHTLDTQANLFDYSYSAPADKAFLKVLNGWKRLNRRWSRMSGAELSNLS